MTSLINNNNITISKQKLNNQQPEEEVRKKRGAGSSNCILLPNGKKTKGRVKIKMEYIGNKLRRYTTFSKRKTGIMKKVFFNFILKKIKIPIMCFKRVSLFSKIMTAQMSIAKVRL